MILTFIEELAVISTDESAICITNIIQVEQ